MRQRRAWLGFANALQRVGGSLPPGWFILRRIARIAIGGILIILGLLALFTPLTPGSWLVVVGLEVLGVRVLLRDRVCAWAEARPASRFRRAACRVFSLDGFEALKRKWRRRRAGRSTQTSAEVPPSIPHCEGSRSTDLPPCETPPVEARVRRRSDP